MLVDDVKAQKEFTSENRLNTYKILNQSLFVTNEKVDYNKLDKILQKKFPTRFTSGILVLNWEGKALDELISQKNIKEFNFYKKQFINALLHVKKKRPNVKVGFYALPFRQYWNIDESFYIKNNALIDILKNQDFLAPSQYVFYIDNGSVKGNLNYIQKNVEYALKLGKQLNKPVYPFVWQRVHPSNKCVGEALIPLNIFEKG